MKKLRRILTPQHLQSLIGKLVLAGKVSKVNWPEITLPHVSIAQMKTIILTGSLIAVSQLSQAQQSPTPPRNPSPAPVTEIQGIQAEAHLNDVLPSECYVRGSYTQNKILSALPRAVSSHGTFLFHCERGLIWHTQTPVEETLIYTRGRKHYYVDAQGTASVLSGKVHKRLAKLLNGLIGADSRYLEKYFIPTVDNNQHVQLAPKKRAMKKFIQAIDIVRETGDGTEQAKEAMNITLRHTENNQTHIVIDDITVFDSLSPSQCEKEFPQRTSACPVLFGQ